MTGKAGVLLIVAALAAFALGRATAPIRPPTLFVVGDDPRPCPQRTWLIGKMVMCVSDANHFTIYPGDDP